MGSTGSAGSALNILLDSRPHCAYCDLIRCEAPLTVLSLARPVSSLRD